MIDKFHDTIQCLASVNPAFIVAGLFCGLMFIALESANIWILLRFFGEKSRFLNGLKYGFTGFFFSSVTPSASGGQPMQLFSMTRDGVQTSHGTLALLLEFFSSQAAMTIMGVGAYIHNHQMIGQVYPAVRYFIWIAIAANVVILSLIIMILANEKIAYGLLSLFRKILNRIPKLSTKRKEKWSTGAENQIVEFRHCSQALAGKKRILLKTIPISVLQMSFLFIIPFIAYRAFGLSETSFITIFSMQAVLHLASSLIPLPGAAGANEGGFLLLYSTIFSPALVVPAVLFSRGISFYSMVLISGMVMIAAPLCKKRRQNRNSALASNSI